MKNFTKSGVPAQIILAALFCFFLPYNYSKAQTVRNGETFSVQRGERPPIDLASVPASAIEEGVFIIKFKAEFADQLEQQAPALNKDGQWRFQIPAVDRLNDLYSISNIEQYFSSPAFHFTEKHKAWGFHLWYKLRAGKNTNIKDIVQDYRSLPELEIADPEYKKILIGGSDNSKYNEIFSEQDLTAQRSNDPRFNDQWHYHNTGQANGTSGADIDLVQAWTLERGNSNVIVAVIDEGIQFSHPDLAGNMWPNIGFNFVAGNSTIAPGGHGCHVGGTIAAVTDNGIGVAGIAGGTGNNDGVRLMSAQVFTDIGNGGFHIAPIWAADHGAAISQNSWGYTEPGVYDQSVLDAIDYFNINGGGFALIDGGITIFAAGNSNSSAPYYPAFYSGAFSVAATNNKDSKSYYSNYGNWIDLSAPGGETTSGSYGGVLSCVTNSGYAFYQGTSMACPHVSGVAALVASYAYGQITASQLAGILRNTTDNHYGANPNYPGLLGTGRLNAYQALLETQNYLTGVLNPTGFTAKTLSTTEILLNWFLNPANNDVLIVWSSENEFGIPDSLQQYQVGDILPGGGMVLYSGNETAFLHATLEPATSYFYKIWAFDASYNYSSGRPVSSITSCPLYLLPFAEGFENSEEMPVCWVQEYTNGNINWLTGSGNAGNDPSTAYEGNMNIYFKAQPDWEPGSSTMLLLPQMNLAPYDSVELKFFFTNASRLEGNESFQDVLRIRYRPAGHSAWQLLSTYDSNVSEWTETTLKLPDQSSTWYLAFEAESHLGHGICIDNVQVTGYGIIATYTIAASAGMNGSITPAGGIMVGQHGNASFLSQSNTHYVIDSLIVDNDFVPDANGSYSYEYFFNDVVQDHTIYVSFKPVDYHVQVSINPSIAGTVQGVGAYPYGSQVSLLAVPAQGFVFNRWFEGGPVTANNPITFTLYTNRNFVALFTPILHTVLAATQNPQAGTTTGSGSYIHGTQVSVNSTSNHGYEFANWTENGVIVSVDNPYNFNVFAPCNLHANHQAALWAIEAVAAPLNAGIIEGTGVYEHGSIVSLSATANNNYSFTAWTENGETIANSNPYSFVADNPRSLIAQFDINTSVANPDKHFFNVYPNPSSGIFTLEVTEPVNYTISDLTGRIIMSEKITAGISHINLQNPVKGLYFMKLQRTSDVSSIILIIKGSS